MRDYRFHCEDCDSYSQCQYYHNRKGTSLICKEFQYGSSVIEQIRAEIELQREEVGKKYCKGEGLTNYFFGLNDGLKDARDIIDKYR